MPIDWMGYGYSALIVIGGIVGYVKAGSVPSLAAGLLFGGFAGLGTYKICQNPKHVWVLLATSASLAGVMGFRFLNSGKFMPAGLMAAASLVMLGRTGLGMLQRPHGP
ncbi:transmembrane protein 14C-like [Paramormyrops kingsleyae]|uniref:Transmembrane protein 14C n=1 Tax=Paramormyrops kingsleyae TaxID=1676925 RepID=A0A3B3S5C5_9TELE|nr:transmembrane protein 14C-like [Paramormyrops kingsleyae]